MNALELIERLARLVQTTGDVPIIISNSGDLEFCSPNTVVDSTVSGTAAIHLIYVPKKQE
jgi:hypothetical protein